MANRDGVERFRAHVDLSLGEAKDDPSPGYRGLHPEMLSTLLSEN